MPDICLDWRMREADDPEIEFAVLAFLILAPLAYFTMRGLVAILG